MHTEETKRKISLALKGRVGYMHGKKHSKATKLKMSLAALGIKKSLEARKNMSLAKKGKPSNRLGMKQPSTTGANNPAKRLEVRIKLSISQKKFLAEHPRTGINGANWRGGKTPIGKIIKSSTKYNIWRQEIFSKDNWTCIICGDRQFSGHKVILHADHIKPFSLYPELRFEVSNGRTLCISCHRKTDTYGGKSISL